MSDFAPLMGVERTYPFTAESGAIDPERTLPNGALEILSECSVYPLRWVVLNCRRLLPICRPKSTHFWHSPTT
jgi:hypothetical protein